MSKKKKIIAIVAILLVIFASFMGGQTFAKYITEVRGTGNARIASWNFNVKDNKDQQIQTININSTVNNETLKDNKIAPGTKGNFIIKVDGTGSDVGIKYDIQIANETTKPRNLIYKYKGVAYNNIEELVKEASGTIDANADNKVVEIQIDWEWPYQTGSDDAQKASNDAIDTEDGKNITNYTFDIIVTGTQVIPNA